MFAYEGMITNFSGFLSPVLKRFFASKLYAICCLVAIFPQTPGMTTIVFSRRERFLHRGDRLEREPWAQASA